MPESKPYLPLYIVITLFRLKAGQFADLKSGQYMSAEVFNFLESVPISYGIGFLETWCSNRFHAGKC